MIFMTVNTLLFDLDGTLIDTAPDLAYALNTLLKENGLNEKPYEQIKPKVAFGGKALVSMGFDCDETHPEFAARHQKLLQIYTDNIDKHSKTFEGIDALLKLIKQRNRLWGIVTNKPENLTHLLLAKLNIKPDVVVCGDTLEFNKPHPAPLLYACAQLGVLTPNCLFVGDDKNDMIAGKNADIKTVAVTYGYGKIEQDWGYDYLIDNPKELERWMY
ncbi:Similar to phosphoglycolate phosphatase, clustered with ubiquinone biosynthesis SAM-dependent O-methyltransferase [uncultured Candidatus Thioglobus sp.]|nr:Similar to phosphoglycolate phosphatase, clustered with ubiquinone biosynthesis SAM-dependent O-methyltransferase [uncultured Candidatus Thioglobus sp.]